MGKEFRLTLNSLLEHVFEAIHHHRKIKMNEAPTRSDKEKELALKYGAEYTIDKTRGGDFCRFELKEFHVWENYYNPNKPWRTAKVTDNRFNTHAGHATLEDAFKWIIAND